LSTDTSLNRRFLDRPAVTFKGDTRRLEIAGHDFAESFGSSSSPKAVEPATSQKTIV
jgi:hypothetical protein